jgi:hypothetical protein
MKMPLIVNQILVDIDSSVGQCDHKSRGQVGLRVSLFSGKVDLERGEQTDVRSEPKNTPEYEFPTRVEYNA